MRRLLGRVLVCGLALPSQPVLAGSVLSAPQNAVVDKAIAEVSAEEKKMVLAWPDGKKLAEFFCAKPGLAAIRKQESTADRVFLGPDDEGVKKLVLTGNTRLAGRRTVRVHGGWKEFSFVCDLDAEAAGVKSFTFSLEGQ